MKRVWFLTMIFSLLLGCSEEPAVVKPVDDDEPTLDDEQEIFLRSFITRYADFTAISLQNGSEQDPYFDDPYTLRIRYNTSCIQYDYRDQYPNKAEYDALCQKHVDMSFNRTVIYTSADYPFPMYGANDWVTVDLVSDADFDAKHPAGTSLGDIVTYHSMSPMRWIRSGYTDTYDWSQYPKDGLLFTYCPNYAVSLNWDYYEFSAMRPVEKHLKDLSPMDLILNGFGRYGISDWFFAYLHFDHGPTMAREHTFTVTLLSDQGKVFTASKAVTFP